MSSSLSSGSIIWRLGELNKAHKVQAFLMEEEILGVQARIRMQQLAQYSEVRMPRLHFHF
jgi:hypothetical protein